MQSRHTNMHELSIKLHPHPQLRSLNKDKPKTNLQAQINLQRSNPADVHSYYHETNKIELLQIKFPMLNLKTVKLQYLSFCPSSQLEVTNFS